MAANMEELEKKMGIKIEAVRAMMLDRFSGLDQKLTAIEEILTKIMETQNQMGKPLETGNPDHGNLTEKDMEKGGVESSKSQDKGKKVAIGGGTGGPLNESGPEKSWRAEISWNEDDQETDDQIWGPRGGFHLGDRGRQRPPWEASSPYGWVGLYTRNYGKDSPPGPDFGMGKDLCGPACAGQQELDFRQKSGPHFGFHEGTIKGQFVNNFVEGWPRSQRGRGPEGFGKKGVEADEIGWVGKKSENDIEKGWSSSGKKAVKTGQDEIFKDASKSNQLGTKNSWACSSGSWSKKVIKTGQDEIFKESSKSDQWETKESWAGPSGAWGKVEDKTDANGEEEEQTGSWASWGKKKDDKTDASLHDSSKPDQWGNKDSGSWGKSVQSEITGKWGSIESDKGHDWSKIVEEKTDSNHGWDASWGKKGHNKPQAQVTTKGSTEKGHEESQKPGSWWKEEGWGPKRKYPDSPVGGPNDGPISSRPLTATRQRLDIFTSDEQEILNEMEPIMQSIRRIMNQDRYNDGDPLSADDQTYILDNVFYHHPEKAQKMGAGIDYIMVSKHMKFQGSRCFYVVSTDGRKEDFSYHKCLKNFVRGKYPDRVDKFIPKYFKNSEPRYPMNRDRGSGPDEARTPRSWSGWDGEVMVMVDEARPRSPAWQQTRASRLHLVGKKLTKPRWRQEAAPRWDP